jgi:hypothetical protein
LFLYPILQEYRHIARLRLLHLKRATPNPGQFTVLVHGIPKTTNESCSSDIGDFFTKYHASSYLFHQVVYKAGKVQKIMVSNSHTTFLFVWRVWNEGECKIIAMVVFL